MASIRIGRAGAGAIRVQRTPARGLGRTTIIKGGRVISRVGRGRKKGRARATMLINRSPSVVPDEYFTQINLAAFATLDQAGGFSLESTSYKANSLLAPDPVTARQPMGFDQLMALYENYIVFGCKAVVKFVNISLGQAECYTEWSTDASAAANPDTVRERAYTQQRLVGTANAGNSIKHVKTYMSTKKMFGLKTLGASNTGYIGNATTDILTGQQYFLYLYALNLDSAASVKVVAETKLTYYVKFFNRIELSAS